MMGVAEAGCVVAVQEDAGAPIVPFADYNVVGRPGRVCAGDGGGSSAK